MDPKEEIHISKLLAYILCHGAQKKKVTIRSDARPKLKGVTLEQIKYIVGHIDKKRYHLQIFLPTTFEEKEEEKVINNYRYHLEKENEGRDLYIRANQGHSLKNVDQIELESLTKALPIVIHGTTLENWSLIKQSEGLSKMNRNHIHLATGLPNDLSIRSGVRSSSQIHIYVYIDMENALNDEITFYRSKNGVILTEGKNSILPLKCFKSVVDKQGNKLL
ncbi:unnamed protein product [Cunninghamella blakesleeana]